MGFIDEMRTHKLRTLKTLVICFVFIGLGLTIALPGPTILDLQLAAQCTLKEAARVLPSRAGGYAIGALLTGFLLDIFDHQILLFWSLLMSTATFFITPNLYDITWMCAVMFVNGLGTGAIDTCGNVWITHMWGKESPPFMQVLHFAYGVGAFISPFIAEPFLLPIVETEVTNPVNPMTTDYITATMNPNATSFSFWESGQELLFSTSNHINSSADHLISPALSYTDLPTFDRSQLRVQWAYAIVSIYNGCVLIMFLVVYFSNRSNKAHPSRLAALQSAAANIAVPSDFSAGGDAQKSEPYSLSSLPDCSPAFPAYSRILVIIFSTLFMHVYCGLEISFGALLAPFTVKSSLQLNKSLSSFITSLYWGTFTFFRILTMLVITYCKPRTVLIANMIIIMGSNVLLLPYGDTCLWALWLGVGLMGLGCSSVFATMIGYVEQMFPVTSRITSGYMTFACLGEFIIPYIVGLFIETNPRVYLYVVFAYSVASCILLMLIMMVQVSASRKARMYLNRSAISNTTNVN